MSYDPLKWALYDNMYQLCTDKSYKPILLNKYSINPQSMEPKIDDHWTNGVIQLAQVWPMNPKGGGCQVLTIKFHAWRKSKVGTRCITYFNRIIIPVSNSTAHF
jgi:hypothetical protein